MYKRKNQKTRIALCTSLLLFTILVLSGCFNVQNNNSRDPVVVRANPYISKIVLNNITLRAFANSLIRNCPANDKECQITTIYRYIVEHYNYVKDPTDIELIQTPFETMQVQGGDCEDLAVFLNSLLENIGIKTYLVLTDNHSYCLVYDVDTDNLVNYVKESIMTQYEKDYQASIRQTFNQTFVIEKYQNWYYGGNGSSFVNDSVIDYLNISYSIRSEDPVDFYVVPSRGDFDLFNEGESFTNFPDYKEENVLSAASLCPYILTNGGVIISNSHDKDTILDVNLLFYYHPSYEKIFKNQTIVSYQIQGKTCVVLDPTAGVYGYPGYSVNLIGEKIAIDPESKQYFYLT